jgi:hypothetical protein
VLSGFRNDFQPKGTLEELLVEKLATLFWRYRRLMIAEAAEIQKGSAFLEWEEEERQEKEAKESFFIDREDSAVDDPSIMYKMTNPQVLERCLDLLKVLKADFECNGFAAESSVKNLTKLYGNGEHLVETLFDSYAMWRGTSEFSDEERKQSGLPSVKQCTSEFLSDLENEMARLDQYKKARASTEAERLKLESLRCNVPDGPQLDRLLKYEASINRDIDRTLTQLERLQRMRLGQPVSSPIKLDISSS